MMIDRYMFGQTPLTAEEKNGLIPSVVTRGDINAFEQENILAARWWVMQKSILRKYDIFSERFLLMLHKRMYGRVWKWAGAFRKTNKNIGVDYFTIPTELHQLLADAEYWLAHHTYSIANLAVIFHHRLVKIHLFAKGNGRHARMCADAIVAKYGGDTLTWGGSFSLAEPGDLRKRYIMALRAADHGDYAQLLTFSCNTHG